MIRIVLNCIMIPMLVINLATLDIDYRYEQTSSKYKENVIANKERRIRSVYIAFNEALQLKKNEGEIKEIKQGVNQVKEGISSAEDNYEENNNKEVNDGIEKEEDNNEEVSEGIEEEEDNNEKVSEEIEKEKDNNKEVSDGIEKEEDNNEEVSEGIEEEEDNNEKVSEEIEKEKDNNEEVSEGIEEEEDNNEEVSEGIEEEEDNNEEVSEGIEEEEDNNEEVSEGIEEEKDNNEEVSEEIEEEEDNNEEVSEEKDEEDKEEREEEDNSHKGSEEIGEVDEGDHSITDSNETDVGIPHIINEDYTLENDYEVKGSLYLNGGILNLNGNILTIKGNLYHEGGDLKVNSGGLIIEGNYYLCKISGAASNENIERGEGKLTLTQRSEVLDIGGDFIIKTNRYEKGELKEATIYLAGDFFYSPVNIKNPLELPETLKLILVGEGEQQTITDTINECRLGTLIIRGRADRIINFNIDYSRIMIYRLEVQSPVQFKTSKKNNFYISNARIEENLLINGDIQTIYKCDVVNSYLTINGNHTNIGKMYLEKSKLEVVGNLLMKYNGIFNMNDTESEIYVNSDLEIKSRENIKLTGGKIVVGKNLIRMEQEGQFVTGETVEVILRGNVEVGQTVKIQGKGITLGRVYLEDSLEKYEFDENVHYTLVEYI